MLLFLLACQDATKPGDPTGTPTTETDDTGPTDTGPASWSADPCARTAGGPPGGSTPADLSELHAAVRYFWVGKRASDVDLALASVLDAEDAVANPDLAAYVAPLGDACALPASAASLGPASVSLVGDVAWVVPGTGAVALPEGTAAVALDLRDLPAVPELRDALAAALAPAMATDAAWPDREERVWDGLVDQVYSEDNTYTTEVVTVPGVPLPASGTEDLPLLLVTGESLAPAAAELAGALKQAGRAWIVGADVPAGVAESSWAPFGDQGVAYRSAMIEGWPDVLPADVSTTSPEAAVTGWATLPSPVAATGDAVRTELKNRNPWGDEPPTQDGLGTVRTTVMVAHGTLRRFFPYFEVVGDTIDDTLVEALATVDPADRCTVPRALGLFAHAVADGHTFFGDLDYTSGCYADVTGYLGVWVLFDEDGLPVVANTAYADVHLGDTLVAIDGVAMSELMADRLAWHGGAVEGYQLDLAFRELTLLRGPVALRLRDPDGVERDVTVDPVEVDVLYTLPFTEAYHPNGRLDDFGAGDIAYLNVDSYTTTGLSQVDAVLDDMDGAVGLVVHMRGYPGVNHYPVAGALIPGAYSSPIFRVPVWTGPDTLTIDESFYALEGDADAYAGPLVLLVHGSCVSAAENFAIMLVGAGRPVAILGTNSAGTNGNITGVRMPGPYYLSFTGMEVLFPDGSRFHGVGIVPDEVIAPTPADLRDGRDPVLERAVELLHGG